MVKERGKLTVRMMKGPGGYTLIQTGGGMHTDVVSEHRTRKAAEKAFSKVTTGKNIRYPKGKKRRRYRITEERSWNDIFGPGFDFL